jgi:hypothetical protein
MLTPRDVVVDPVLSNVSIAFQNEMYIADMIMPVVSVSKQAGKYYVYDKAKFRRNRTERAIGSGANEVEYGLTTASFFATDHALKEKVPFEIIDQADSALDPESDATENITEQLLLDKEIALATSMTATATMTSNTTLSGTSQWSDYTNSKPIEDVRTGARAIQKAIGRKPNVLILGKEAFDVLQDHPDILERVKYSALGVVTEELLARVFNVEKVIVAEAIYNTANEGQTDSLGYIWGKNAILCYVTPSPRLRSITLGFCFRYGNREVKKWDDADANARYIRANENYVEKFVAVTAGYLIKNCVA